MANYNCLLIDIDNTLLDFTRAEGEALNELFRKYGLSGEEEMVQQYQAVNISYWQKFNRGEIRMEKLLVERFDVFLKTIGVAGNPSAMNRDYLNFLAAHAELLPGALDFVREASEVATLMAVTNGVEHVQLARLKASGLDVFLDDVVISQQVGVAKPSPKIFQLALRRAGVEDASRTLVLGDSLSADIKGGLAAGLDTCWLNLPGRENKGGSVPRFEVRSYEEVYPIIMEPEELEQVGLRVRRHQDDALALGAKS